MKFDCHTWEDLLEHDHFAETWFCLDYDHSFMICGSPKVLASSGTFVKGVMKIS